MQHYGMIDVLGAWVTEEFGQKLNAISACYSHLIEYGIILFIFNNTTFVCCFRTMWLQWIYILRIHT